MSSRPVTLHTEHMHSRKDSCRVDLSPYMEISSRPVTLHTEHIHSKRDSCQVDLSPYIQNTYILRGIVVKSTCHPTYRTHTF